MKLIVMLIAIGMERGLNWGHFLKRFSWFDAYVNLIQSWVSKLGIWRGVPAILFIIIPLLIIAAIILLLFSHFCYGIVGFILAILMLLYSFDNNNIHECMSAYLRANTPEDKEAAFECIKKLVGEKPENQAELNRALTKNILSKFNESMFAVLFWFMVLGPLGALFYRIVVLTKEYAQVPEHDVNGMATIASVCQSILDWIPARLLAFGYALAGHFVKSFNYWLQNVLSGLGRNDEVMQQAGLLALDLQDSEATEANSDENKHALALLDRSIIIYLVIIALFVIGSLF